MKNLFLALRVLEIQLSLIQIQLLRCIKPLFKELRNVPFQSIPKEERPWLGELTIKQALLQYGSRFGIRLVDLDQLLGQDLNERIKQMNPERYQLCQQHSPDDFESLSNSGLCDRVLGCDLAVRVDGGLVFIDITVGGSGFIRYKQNKFNGLKELLQDLGVKHAVVVAIGERFYPDMQLAEGIAEFIKGAIDFIVDIRIDSKALQLCRDQEVVRVFARRPKKRRR
jgi:hypothetical protein